MKNWRRKREQKIKTKQNDRFPIIIRGQIDRMETRFCFLLLAGPGRPEDTD